MKLSFFDYPLDKKRIAQYPLPERDNSKLLVLHRKKGILEHRVFHDILQYLNQPDTLVLNDTKVLPLRLYGKKVTGGKVEIFLLKEYDQGIWSILSRGIKEGIVYFNKNTWGEVFNNGRTKMIRFSINITSELLEQLGTMPLPPYIKRAAEKQDTNNYQTVYAVNPGAVAAPTAGLHFTQRLLESIKTKRVSVAMLTLYVGHGTFKAITVDDVQRHIMDSEDYYVPGKTANQYIKTKTEKGKIIAVGTTVTRTLESAWYKGSIKEGHGTSSLFIYPGYTFKAIDALVTNFHLPKSTPFILTASFAGLELLKKAYQEAQEKEYRFFSYGDAMLIL